MKIIHTISFSKGNKVPQRTYHCANFIFFVPHLSPFKKITPENQLINRGLMYQRWESNPHSRRNTILSRARLPIPPLWHYEIDLRIVLQSLIVNFLVDFCSYSKSLFYFHDFESRAPVPTIRDQPIPPLWHCEIDLRIVLQSLIVNFFVDFCTYSKSLFYFHDFESCAPVPLYPPKL